MSVYPGLSKRFSALAGAVVAGTLLFGLTALAQTVTDSAGPTPPPGATMPQVPPRVANGALQIGNPAFATNQATVGATATLISAARYGRGAVTIVNHGATAVYVGGPGVTATTGALLPGIVGANVTIQTQGAVYGVTASGTQIVSAIEVY